MKKIIQKLDLDDYINKFQQFLARKKPVFMQGDINLHYKYIKALGRIEFPTPPQVKNLDIELNLLKKQSILRLDELYSFVEIIIYFNRLKNISMPPLLDSWISDINIPDEITTILSYFNDEGEINSQIDKSLFNIEKSIKINKRDIKDTLYKMAHSSKLRDYLVDTQVHFNNGEETLLVRGGFNNAIKANVVGRSSNGYFYIIPQSISHLKEKQSALINKKEEIIYEYCKNISTIFHKWERFLNYINIEFDRFDNYQARVTFASSYEYSFVLPQKEKRVELVEFLHPAISDGVPLSINLSRKIMLVTGVNAGGKTMLLKSLLSAVYLSKYLLPFKCDEHKTKIGHYKNIEAIIDDPQSIKNDISTFAGRMVEFSKLFSTNNAIVGVDEIELGTDSDEAASLFRVMLDELSNRDITFIVTTHHKRLASLMGVEDSVDLIAAIYDEAMQKPTYRFLQGSIGKSYAFETAQRYGIPPNIIDKSKQVHGEDKERLNELIEQSTSLEREMRAKINKLDVESQKLIKKERYLDTKRDELEDEYKKRLADMELQYRDAIKKAQDALRVQESREGRKLLNQAHKIQNKKIEESKVQEKIELKVGDSIKYLTHRGEIISIRGNSAMVVIDGIKMNLKLNQLKRVSKIKKIKPKKVNLNIEKSRASVSIKVIGMRGDETIDKVDKFISDALINNLSQIEIIHGTGGGILSKLISQYLKNHPRVEAFYRMKGNLGITVVEL
ncbi:Recombination inhibitory protein MutS2 [hydrothermal vent metagenome]|uniref:Recombination inhibitory protein MutS2 n=1 Tax=hydrothermal vent metagenome TaxID=652676 RepID=A0A1W1EHP3_9ZZZZ